MGVANKFVRFNHCRARISIGVWHIQCQKIWYDIIKVWTGNLLKALKQGKFKYKTIRLTINAAWNHSVYMELALLRKPVNWPNK